MNVKNWHFITRGIFVLHLILQTLEVTNLSLVIEMNRYGLYTSGALDGVYLTKVRSVTTDCSFFSVSLGQVSARAFAFAFIADTCVVGFLLVSAFFFFHLFLLFRGQTTREWYSSRRPYNLGLLGNLRQALGLRWYLSWLCPLIPSPLPGDGINFQVTGSLEPTR